MINYPGNEELYAAFVMQQTKLHAFGNCSISLRCSIHLWRKLGLPSDEH